MENVEAMETLTKGSKGGDSFKDVEEFDDPLGMPPAAAAAHDDAAAAALVGPSSSSSASSSASAGKNKGSGAGLEPADEDAAAPTRTADFIQELDGPNPPVYTNGRLPPPAEIPDIATTSFRLDLDRKVQDEVLDMLEARKTAKNYCQLVRRGQIIERGESFRDIEAHDLIRVVKTNLGNPCFIFFPQHLPDGIDMERVTMYTYTLMHKHVMLQDRSYMVIWVCNNADWLNSKLPMSWFFKAWRATPSVYFERMSVFALLHASVSVRMKMWLSSWTFTLGLTSHSLWRKIDFVSRLEYLERYIHVREIKMFPEEIKMHDIDLEAEAMERARHEQIQPRFEYGSGMHDEFGGGMSRPFSGGIDYSPYALAGSGSGSMEYLKQNYDVIEFEPRQELNPDGTPREKNSAKSTRSTGGGPKYMPAKKKDPNDPYDPYNEDTEHPQLDLSAVTADRSEIDYTPRMRLRPKGLPLRNWEKSDDEIENPHKYRHKSSSGL